MTLVSHCILHDLAPEAPSTLASTITSRPAPAPVSLDISFYVQDLVGCHRPYSLLYPKAQNGPGTWEVPGKYLLRGPALVSPPVKWKELLLRLLLGPFCWAVPRFNLCTPDCWGHGEPVSPEGMQVCPANYLLLIGKEFV